MAKDTEDKAQLTVVLSMSCAWGGLDKAALKENAIKTATQELGWLDPYDLKDVFEVSLPNPEELCRSDIQTRISNWQVNAFVDQNPLDEIATLKGLLKSSVELLRELNNSVASDDQVIAIHDLLKAIKEGGVEIQDQIDQLRLPDRHEIPDEEGHTESEFCRCSPETLRFEEGTIFQHKTLKGDKND